MALSQRSRWGLSLTLLAICVIAWFTLRPSPEDAEAAARSPFICLFPCGDESVRDAVLNIILFIPFGLALRLWLPARRAWLITLLCTCAIEFTQYHWLLGRDASLRDILTNALGGAIGVALVTHWRPLLLPGPGLSRQLAATAGVLWIGLIGATGWLIRPSLPRSVYWGQWAPELGQFDTWGGRLLDARINGVLMPTGRMTTSEAVRSELLSDSVLVTATIVAGPAPKHIAPIASVFDSEQREIFVLGQRGRGLVFRIRTGIRALEMGGQVAELADAIGAAGDTLHIAGGVVRGQWVISAERGGVRRELRLPFSAGLLWSGLMPIGIYLEPGTVWLSALWLGGLRFPIGYWLRRTGMTARVLLATALGAAVTLGGVALLAGLASPEWPEVAGTLLGPVVGWLAAGAAEGLH